MKTTPATIYERNSEHAEYSIHCARTGWVLEHHSRYQGTSTGDRWLIAYGTKGIDHEADLGSAWNDTYTIGEILFGLTCDSRRYGMEKGVRCLDRGTVLR